MVFTTSVVQGSAVVPMMVSRQVTRDVASQSVEENVGALPLLSSGASVCWWVEDDCAHGVTGGFHGWSGDGVLPFPRR